MSARILFVEVPGFHAELERAGDPTLSGRPVIVGGDPRKRGLVQAATPEARERGVTEGMPMIDALQRCPEARARVTDMRRAREAAAELRAVLRREAGRVEAAGLGAAYVDAAERGLPPAALAQRVRKRVQEELRLPVRIGGAPVKFVARLAAEEAGPDGIRIVEPGEVAAFLGPLGLERLPGVGPNTAARLHALGARTVADVARLGRAALEQALGNHGLAVHAAALGQGESRLRASRHPQTLSQEATLAAGERDRLVLGEQLSELAARLSRALAREDLMARRIVLKLRYADGGATTRTRTLERPVATAGEIEGVGGELLSRTEAGVRPVRKLGLAAADLRPGRRETDQLPLFPGES